MKTVSLFRVLRSRILPFVAAAVLAIVALPTHAQFNASLTGSVQDSTGAAIPGATVTLTDTATQQVRTLTTNGSGVYTFNELPPGSYTISATASNFSSATVSNVSVAAETPREVNVTLKPGKANETVTVNADAIAVLQTGDASIGATIDSEEIQRLPIFGSTLTNCCAPHRASRGMVRAPAMGMLSSCPTVRAPAVPTQASFRLRTRCRSRLTASAWPITIT